MGGGDRVGDPRDAPGDPPGRASRHRRMQGPRGQGRHQCQDAQRGEGQLLDQGTTGLGAASEQADIKHEQHQRQAQC